MMAALKRELNRSCCLINTISGICLHNNLINISGIFAEVIADRVIGEIEHIILVKTATRGQYSHNFKRLPLIGNDLANGINIEGYEEMLVDCITNDDYGTCSRVIRIAKPE